MLVKVSWIIIFLPEYKNISFTQVNLKLSIWINWIDWYLKCQRLWALPLHQAKPKIAGRESKYAVGSNLNN